MKIQFKNTCSEKWDEMKDHSQGKFCAQCEKTVVDLADKEAHEITQLMLKHTDGLCGPMTSEQLKVIYPDRIDSSFKLPYSRAASAVMIAASLGAATTAQAINSIDNSFNPSVEVTTTDFNTSIIEKEVAANLNDESNTYIKVTGKVVNPDDKPLENVKVTFYGLSNYVSSYSKADGTFTLRVPEYLISDKNLISFDYYNIKLNGKEMERYDRYESSDLILNKNEMKVFHNIQAEPMRFYLGGLGIHQEIRDPVILVNGMKMPFKDYQNHIEDKNSEINYSTMVSKYLSGYLATEIYGDKASGGLYLFHDQIPQ